VVFALAVGVALWAIFLGLWHGVGRLFAALRSGASGRASRGPSRRVEPRLR
jgi:hypothetical protein